MTWSGIVSACGLVGGLQTIKAGRKEADHHLAHDIVERCFHKGLLMFAPVGAQGQTVKIAPPLRISRDALEEGVALPSEAVDEAVAALVSVSEGVVDSQGKAVAAPI